jgi:hypothetical protein
MTGRLKLGCDRSAGGDEPDARRRRRRRLMASLAVGAFLVEWSGLLRRGYRVGANVVVRCQKGHLFTTIWLPAASVKAARLGWWRFQRCPVGGHWSIVTAVRRSSLTEQEQRDAAAHHDIRVP